MTAFEILLSDFYDNMEKNEPQKRIDSKDQYSTELFENIKQFIETAFSKGQDLSYSKSLSGLTEKICELFQKSSHEAWSRVRLTFIENDLHIIRRDRSRSEIENLRTRLYRSF